jgi:proprotein convertase subtilisin/kexin type 5
MEGVPRRRLQTCGSWQYEISPGPPPTCGNCDDTCAECNGPNSTSCTSCYDGDYLDSGSCNQCDSNCHTCSAFSTCTSCEDPFWLNVNYCEACGIDCLACVSDTSCTTCPPAHFDDSGNCVGCPSGCSGCSSALFCTGCDQGYFMDYQDLCQACESPCISCTASDCLTCPINHYISGSTCLVCAANCATCGGLDPCLTCIANRTKISGALLRATREIC